uniref:Phosphatidylinositol-glycan biosynthesis class W protein n=1 Tax=Diabrotica virgifera virgifera TaxID=50390 RepID=A0A6P7F052_DIAVI
MRLPEFFWNTTIPEIITSSSIPIRNRAGFETIAVILPSFFYSLIIVVLETYISLKTSSKFVLELATIVLPITLGMTLLSEYSNLMIGVLSIFSALLLGVSYKKRTSTKKSESFHTSFITNSRSTINILSVIAILAVDFDIFPSRFTKMDTLGYSLMDTGVGLYVFANGIVSPESRGVKNPISKSIKGSLPLFLIGSARFVLTKLFHYHVPEGEYGVHWNFFITLAVTKLFTSFLLNVFSIRNIYVNATMLTLAHQILLVCGLQEFVFEDFKRDNFVKANKEGLVSSIGFISLYLYSVHFGYVLDLKNKNQKFSSVFKKFVIAILLFLTLSVAFQQTFGISRRVANAAYVFWILFIGIFMTGLFYILQTIQIAIFGPTRVVLVSYIFEAVNHNGLVFFLIANVLTGVINMSMNTRKVDTIPALLIVMGYMTVNCLVVAVLYSRGFKLKL